MHRCTTVCSPQCDHNPRAPVSQFSRSRSHGCRSLEPTKVYRMMPRSTQETECMVGKVGFTNSSKIHWFIRSFQYQDPMRQRESLNLSAQRNSHRLWALGNTYLDVSAIDRARNKRFIHKRVKLAEFFSPITPPDSIDA